MRHQNLKHLFLVVTSILLVGLISLTGCNGDSEASSGTVGSGNDNQPYQSDGSDDSCP